MSNNSLVNAGLNGIGFATVSISTPTLYAVVNTTASGQASVVLSTGTNNIGVPGICGKAISSDGGRYDVYGSINSSTVKGTIY
jgi:hypothetical protein